MLKYNMIQVSGQPITRADFAVNAGDVIEYVKKTGRKKGIAPPVPIIFEDDDLLIAEKPAGLLTFGERGTGGTSLYRLLKDFFNQRSGGRQRLHVVHRLDREVSGIVLFAKNAKVLQHIKIIWYENNGNTTFTEQVITTNTDYAQSVYATDLDGDGD
ncbi:MAG: pseudouridine synthase, partial [Desulfobacterales bacterium]